MDISIWKLIWYGFLFGWGWRVGIKSADFTWQFLVSLVYVWKRKKPLDEAAKTYQDFIERNLEKRRKCQRSRRSSFIQTFLSWTSSIFR